MKLKEIFSGLQVKTIGVLCALLAVLIAALLTYNMYTLRDITSQEMCASSGILADSVYNGIMHPMEVNDAETINGQMKAYGANMSDADIFIFGVDKRITYSSKPKLAGQGMDKIMASTQISRALDGLLAARPDVRTNFVDIRDKSGFVTVLKPMANQKTCHHCHGASKKVLGGVAVRRDISCSLAQEAGITNANIAAGIFVILMAGTLIYLLIRAQVIKPVWKIRDVSQRMAGGDLTFKAMLAKRDELGVLARSINQVSDNLSRVIAGVEDKAGRLAQGTASQAAAMATLLHEEKIAERARLLRAWAAELAAELEALGVRIFPTETYFFLADFAPHDATEIATRLREQGILVKPLGDARLGPGFMRVTTSVPEDNARFVDTLKQIL